MVDYCECCGRPLPTKELPFGIEFDEFSGEFTRGDVGVRFPRQQVKIILALLDFQACSKTKQYVHSEMCSELLGSDKPEIAIVDVQVCKIRKKLSELGLTIVTEWGRGYRLEVAETQRASA